MAELTKLNYIKDIAVDENMPVVTVNLTVYESGVTNRILLYQGDYTTGTIAALNSSASGTGTYTITAYLNSSQRNALLAVMPNTQTYSILGKVITYKNGTEIGTDASSVSVRLTTSVQNSAPEFTSFGVSDTNETTSEMTGGLLKFIRNKSVLHINASSAQAKNGASIVKYQAKIEEKIVESAAGSFDFGAIPYSGSCKLELSVVDSRGYSTKLTIGITVYEYSNISLDSYIARRENSVGTDIHLEFTGTYSPLVIDGEAKNALQLTAYRYKASTDPSYGANTDIEDVLSRDGEFVYTNDAFLTLPDDSAYYMRLTVSDKLSTKTVTLFIPKGKPLVSLRSERVGINTNTPQSALDVEGNIRMNGFNVQGFIGSISVNDNLDTLQDGGIYYSSGGSSDYNYPSGLPGFLEVFASSNAVMQRYTVISGNTIYARTKNSSVWSQWCGVTLSAT